MKNVYPVFFTQAKDVILIEVPDFGILTQGKKQSKVRKPNRQKSSNRANQRECH